MTAGKTTRALCACDGAAVPADLAAQPWDHRIEISTRGPEPEVNFVVERLLGKLGGLIDPRVQDVLSLAAYCFAADRLVRRGGPIDIHREGWRRELVLCVPVADPAFWCQIEAARRLTDALNFGTEDRWSFFFDAADRSAPQLEIEWDDRELLDQPDTVVLFSGGTDSLCGLIDAVKEGAKPVLVSHWTADHVKSRQQRLRTAVRRAFGPWEYPLVQVELHHRGKEDGESSQRTRGFLFACLGAAIAAHLRIGTVLLPENGYVGINPRINDQLVGALASRGTHPKFVFLFNRLIELVFGGAVEVVNPLWDKTRAEALRSLADAGGAELLAQTYSCGKLQGRPVGKPHCGGCSQCVDRRFAVIQAGLEEHDPTERYEVDVFGRSIPEGEARTVALSYLRFAEETALLDPEAILDRRRELDHCVDPDDPDFDTRSLQLADLLRRHAAEVLATMATMYRHHARGWPTAPWSWGRCCSSGRHARRPNLWTRRTNPSPVCTRTEPLVCRGSAFNHPRRDPCLSGRERCGLSSFATRRAASRIASGADDWRASSRHKGQLCRRSISSPGPVPRRPAARVRRRSPMPVGRRRKEMQGPRSTPTRSRTTAPAGKNSTARSRCSGRLVIRTKRLRCSASTTGSTAN